MMSSIEEIDQMRKKCIGCKKCITTCPSFKHGGCNPFNLVNGIDTNVQYCIGCGNCSVVCKQLDPAKLIQRLIFIIKDKKLPDYVSETGYILPKNTMVCPEPQWIGDDVSIMPGCIVACKAPFIEYAASIALKKMGIKAQRIPKSVCCTHPVVFRSYSDEECRNIIDEMSDSAENSDVVTLCGGCSYEFTKTGHDAQHIIHFFYTNMDRLPLTKNPLKVALEPGCAAMPLLDEMITIIKHMGFEYVENEAGCCGKSIEMAPEMMKERIFASKDADAIIVGCPMCFLKYDSATEGKPVMHISELVSFAFGDDESLKYHNIRLNH